MTYRIEIAGGKLVYNGLAADLTESELSIMHILLEKGTISYKDQKFSVPDFQRIAGHLTTKVAMLTSSPNVMVTMEKSVYRLYNDLEPVYLEDTVFDHMAGLFINSHTSKLISPEVVLMNELMNNPFVNYTHDDLRDKVYLDKARADITILHTVQCIRKKIEKDVRNPLYLRGHPEIGYRIGPNLPDYFPNKMQDLCYHPGTGEFQHRRGERNAFDVREDRLTNLENMFLSLLLDGTAKSEEMIIYTLWPGLAANHDAAKGRHDTARLIRDVCKKLEPGLEKCINSRFITREYKRNQDHYRLTL